MSDQVLMSIRQPYVQAILSGTKTVELRRRRPSFGEHTKVLVYESGGSQRVVGWFLVGGLITEPIEALWRRVGSRSGVTKAEFLDYFDGCAVGHAIEIAAVHQVSPRPLSFRPPQSWQYLRPGNARHRRLIHSAAHATA